MNISGGSPVLLSFTIHQHTLSMDSPSIPIPETDAEIAVFVQAFEARTLPIEQWTHQAHLITAAWYLYHHEQDAATCLLRSGIIAYNVSQGGKNTPTGGYHESITLFWIWAVNAFVAPRKDKQSISDICQELLSSPTGDKGYPFRFYSKDQLMSTKARARWVEPDVKGLK